MKQHAADTPNSSASTGRNNPPLGRHRRALHRRGRGAPARHRCTIEHTLAELGAGQAVGAAATTNRSSTRSARSPATRPCSRSGRPARRSTERLAGRGRRQRRRRDVSRPEPVSGQQRAAGGQAHQQRAAARRPDRARRGQRQRRLVRADRRRRRGRLRRRAQRVRADEGDDRGRRGRRALRGPARLARRSAATWAARCWCRRAQFVEKLVAARLAADVMGVPTLLVARTDAEAADLLTSDIDARDRPFLTGERTRRRASTRPQRASTRRSPAAWPTRRTRTWSGARPASRTSTRRRQFAEAIHAKFPGKLLAYNCSPSFNWKKNLDDATIAKFQKELGAMGYKFQFITLAGFHALNYSMFELAHGYARAADERVRRSCRKPSSPRPTRASPRSSTSARSAPVTSTR